MIPGGDHSSRSLLLRRVSSWSEVRSTSRGEGGGIIETSSVDEVTEEGEEFSLASEDLNTPLLPSLEYEDESDSESLASIRRKKEWRLWGVFLLLVISGVANVVLAKLQSLPMYNYPTFLNLYANFLYILMSFAYIIPSSYLGWFHNSIHKRHLFQLSKRPFLIMGFLDALSAAMQVLATFYLPGTLLVILPQVAIPVSIVASQILLKEKFTIYQYGGAVTVVFGVVVVLLPFWTHQRAPEYTCQAIAEETEEFCTLCQIEDSEEACLSHIVMNNNQEVGLDAISNSTVTYYCEWLSREDSLRQDDVLVFIWSLVMMVACIPMVLSSVYKQMALRVQLDPILVNGYVAIFQLLFGIPLSIPSGMISSPKVSPLKLPENWAEATRCLFLQANTIESGCHPDQCAEAALFVHLGLLSSAVYTISMMFVLKYGSASILYLGLTLIVPLGHLVFSIHSWTVHWSDVGGLIFLLAGLIMYRFGHDNYTEGGTIQEEDEEGEEVQVHEEGIIVLNNTNQDMVSQEGFLEFLREPFMMCGDI